MNIFILIPSFKNEGPIKGAIAIANLLCSDYNIFLVSIRDNFKPSHNSLSSNVNVFYLSADNYFNKYLEYKELLLKSSKRIKTVSFSMLFFPDLFNALIRINNVVKVSSVRSNMFKNYYYDYGYFGFIYAVIHYIFFRFIENILVMDQSMLNTVKYFTSNKIFIICNFIDEKYLSHYKDIQSNCRTNLIFLGSLTKRKGVDKLLRSFSKVLHLYPNLTLDIVGSGPELDNLISLVNQLNIQNNIVFHGQLDQPYNLLSNSKIFILPSESEGTSRASLEALFFNVPVVLKNVDGNKYLINSRNGILFDHYGDLEFALTKILTTNYDEGNLLPIEYTSIYVHKKFINFFSCL